MTDKNSFDLYLDSVSKKRQSLRMKQYSISSKTVEIVLRTHSTINVHGGTPRYIDVPKHEIAKKCAISLINSVNGEKNNKIKITWLDDNSTKEFLDEMFEVFKHCSHPWEYVPLGECKGFDRSYNYSAWYQFKSCRDSTADIVYSVEDDYLHCPAAISELLNSYKYLQNFFNVEDVCLFPYDYPDEYIFNENEKYHIVRSKNRHWRSTTWTTNTLMTSPRVFREHWDKFEQLATEFRVWNKQEHNFDFDTVGDLVWEENTINEIWKNHVLTFNPIPSLALHVQSEKERDDFIDWRYWWRNFTVLNKGVSVEYK